MRTVTNVYLLNLAVSDLLLGVFCMPFTLVGQVLRNFIFGAAMCKIIPYFQAVCVSVGVWTLVAISLERYFAICRPLKSRRWQTQFHAYKMIVFVWISSLLWTSPIVIVSKLKGMRMGRHKCREEWPNPISERAFNLFLDAILLLVPLIIMSMAYSLIVLKLWKGLRNEIKHSSNRTTPVERRNSRATINGVIIAKDGNESPEEDFGESPQRFPSLGRNPSGRSSTRASMRNRKRSRGSTEKPEKVKVWLKKAGRKVTVSNRPTQSNNVINSVMLMPVNVSSSRSVSPCGENKEDNPEESIVLEEQPCYTFSRHAIRSNYMDKSIEAKKKVIRMLFVVVAEFFVCWAPLHVLNTWYLFSPEFIYQNVGSTGVSLVQLLAYISSCCNPITYCFMNKKFRQAFLNVFHRYRICSFGKRTKERILQLDTLKCGNNSIVFEGRVAANRSEIMELESEDRV